MLFRSLGQAACTVGGVLVDWRLRALDRALVRFVVVGLARILSDGPLIVVMWLVAVRHAAPLNRKWNMGMRRWVNVLVTRARLWLLAMLGFAVWHVPCNMVMLVFADLVVRTPVWLLAMLGLGVWYVFRVPCFMMTVVLRVAILIIRTAMRLLTMFGFGVWDVLRVPCMMFVFAGLLHRLVSVI